MSDLKQYMHDLGTRPSAVREPPGKQEPIGQVFNEIQIQRIQKLLNSSSWRLTFPEDFELDFQTYYVSRFFKQMRMVSMLGLLVLVTFTFLNQILLSETKTFTGIMDFQYVAPVIGLGVLLLLMQNFQRYYKAVFFIFTVCIGVALVIMLQMAAPNLDLVYFMAIMLLQVYAFSFMRLKFWSALWCAISLFMVFATCFLTVELVLDRHTIVLSVFYLVMSGISLTTNYAMERSVRYHYLQHRMLLFQAEALGMINYKLQNECEIDGLTGIYNRTKFDKTFSVEWQRAQRSGGNVALLMIDVDAFKEYNDNYGHQMGDDVLKQLANVLTTMCRRAGDLAMRYGGDEFLILLPDTTQEGAVAIAKSIQEAIFELNIPHMYSECAQVVTVSIGLAISHIQEKPQEEPNTVMKLADSALYKAKKLGRNRVETS